MSATLDMVLAEVRALRAEVAALRAQRTAEPGPQPTLPATDEMRSLARATIARSRRSSRRRGGR